MSAMAHSLVMVKACLDESCLQACTTINGVQSKEEASVTCPICLELPYKPFVTACGHVFCLDCFEGYIDSENFCKPMLCPTCKQVAVADPTHPIGVCHPMQQLLTSQHPLLMNARQAEMEGKGAPEFMKHYTSPLLDVQPHAITWHCPESDRALRLEVFQKIVRHLRVSGLPRELLSRSRQEVASIEREMYLAAESRATYVDCSGDRLAAAVKQSYGKDLLATASEGPLSDGDEGEELEEDGYIPLSHLPSPWPASFNLPRSGGTVGDMIQEVLDDTNQDLERLPSWIGGMLERVHATHTPAGDFSARGAAAVDGRGEVGARPTQQQPDVVQALSSLGGGPWMGDRERGGVAVSGLRRFGSRGELAAATAAPEHHTLNSPRMYSPRDSAMTAEALPGDWPSADADAGPHTGPAATATANNARVTPSTHQAQSHLPNVASLTTVRLPPPSTLQDHTSSDRPHSQGHQTPPSATAGPRLPSPQSQPSQYAAAHPSNPTHPDTHTTQPPEPSPAHTSQDLRFAQPASLHSLPTPFNPASLRVLSQPRPSFPMPSRPSSTSLHQAALAHAAATTHTHDHQSPSSSNLAVSSFLHQHNSGSLSLLHQHSSGSLSLLHQHNSGSLSLLHPHNSSSLSLMHQNNSGALHAGPCHPTHPSFPHTHLTSNPRASTLQQPSTALHMQTTPPGWYEGTSRRSIPRPQDLPRSQHFDPLSPAAAAEDTPTSREASSSLHLRTMTAAAKFLRERSARLAARAGAGGGGIATEHLGRSGPLGHLAATAEDRNSPGLLHSFPQHQQQQLHAAAPSVPPKQDAPSGVPQYSSLRLQYNSSLVHSHALSPRTHTAPSQPANPNLPSSHTPYSTQHQAHAHTGIMSSPVPMALPPTHPSYVPSSSFLPLPSALQNPHSLTRCPYGPQGLAPPPTHDAILSSVPPAVGPSRQLHTDPLPSLASQPVHLPHRTSQTLLTPFPRLHQTSVPFQAPGPPQHPSAILLTHVSPSPPPMPTSAANFASNFPRFSTPPACPGVMELPLLHTAMPLDPPCMSQEESNIGDNFTPDAQHPTDRLQGGQGHRDPSLGAGIKRQWSRATGLDSRWGEVAQNLGATGIWPRASWRVLGERAEGPRGEEEEVDSAAVTAKRRRR